MEKPFPIADETFVLPFSLSIPGLGLLNLSPLVIRGKQPMLVDTGAPVFRDAYMEAAFSLVEPKDVRWIFLSHDDRDHAGNLMQVLDACPNAKLITNFVGVGRLSEEWSVPMSRAIFMNDGDVLDIGDRTVAVIRPPLFDSPATRGLWDPKTKVYYSVDAFGAVIPHMVEDASQLPADAYESGLSWFNRANHPWHEYVDLQKLAPAVDRVRRLDARTIVSFHAPPAHHRSNELCEALLRIAAMERLPMPSSIAPL